MASARRRRWAIDWRTPEGLWRAVEPTPAEVAAAAPRLAGFYNEPHNRRMMTNTQELDEAEVRAHFAALAAEGGLAFLLEGDGDLIGDGDLRGLTATDAELAILIGDRGRQGQGLGTRFAIMLHAFAFALLGLERVYAAVSVENAASRRLFAKLGHQIDDGARARRCADDPSEVTLSVTARRFQETCGAAAAAVSFAARDVAP